MGEKERVSAEFEMKERDPGAPVLPVVNPLSEKPAQKSDALHPAVYVATWISLSSSVILFNKYLLDTMKFSYPIVLTTWHLAFATLMTQLLARFTTVLDSRKKVPMTGRIYLRAIVPIGVMFSLSLICGNLTYLYLSVSFIQMLKATTPVAVLIVSWIMGVSPASMKTLGNVALIVIGVIIASFGEIKFVFIGFMFQLGGIVFEAVRLVMVEKLLSSAEFKMDPLVSLYYFAPACAIINGVTAMVFEVPKMHWSDVERVGYTVLLANAMIAFLLNVSVVFLIGRTSGLVMTLCGVLKDILLVAASMLIFADPVSPLQFFGYSIALGGLVYYKLGGDKIKEHVSVGTRAWGEFGQKRPVARKLTIGIMIFGVIVLILGGIGGSGVAPGATDRAKGAIGAILGQGTGAAR
ncbi:hypothetical protein B0A48_17876 [Cryoendolithus antarcticus]|uniref:Sugar phosphate transporter domain-containing protein n=1 Tax=Cryoendolithus antarcticus TaxID=1507870 RepID=A0A1V8SAB1_9PEZI|nr:hypothetical protein B0A48_17876 [Cryoendolithus antarcticus]